jgi:hypothetical protein
MEKQYLLLISYTQNYIIFTLFGVLKILGSICVVSHSSIESIYHKLSFRLHFFGTLPFNHALRGRAGAILNDDSL